MPKFEPLISGLSFTECPRWHGGRLYFSDFYTKRVLAVAPDGTVETIAKVEGQPSGLGFLPDGQMLIVSMRDRKIIRRELDSSLVEHAVSCESCSLAFERHACRSRGASLGGKFRVRFDGRRKGHHYESDCSRSGWRRQGRGCGTWFSQRMALTADGSTLIVAETTMNRLSAFDLTAGELGERRTWAAFGDQPTSEGIAELLAQVDVAPDGICLDAEGAVWVADAMHGRLIRVAEGGGVLEELKTDGMGAFACMLGGDDGRTLFASVAPTFHEAEASANHRAAIWMTDVDVPGAGLP